MSKNAWLWVVLLVVLVFLHQIIEQREGVSEQITYSQFLDDLQEGRIDEVVLGESKITGSYKDSFSSGISSKFITNAPKEDGELIPTLREQGVKFDNRPAEESSLFQLLLLNLLPIVILVGLWFLVMRQMQAGSGKALSFGKSKAKLLEDGKTKVTFEDVAGINESKAELEAIVSFLKDPKKYTKLGGRIPRGVLLVGSPGTGKTLLARAIAGEAGVPFFSISGSDFVEMFVGVGASRVRDLFMKGKKNAPCIIFIDEIDAVGRHRGAGLGGGHDEREQTLNQLLVEMDGFEANEGVILIAATNRPDVLDPALLRPGRFDRTVVVPLPDIKGRLGILNVHAKKTPLSEDVNMETIAKGTPGFSGAELANLVNEAALTAAFKDQDKVRLVDFEEAKDKLIMGVERRSMVLSEEEKRTTSWHEAGHTIVALHVEHADPIHKVTIVPRGSALGLMQQLPEEDRHTYRLEYWLDRICVAFGGRAAEELAFDVITTGASSDIQMATDVARRMVCEWGMSEKLGPLAYGQKDDAPFLGRELSYKPDYSGHTANEIDKEVRRIVEEQQQRAREILKNHKEELDNLAEALLEYETLDGQQVKKAIKGEELNISIRDHKPPSIKKDDSDEEETLPLGAQIATETND